MNHDEIEQQLAAIGARTASVRAPAHLERLTGDRIEGTTGRRRLAWPSSLAAVAAAVVVMSVAGTGLALAVSHGVRGPIGPAPGATPAVLTSPVPHTPVVSHGPTAAPQATPTPRGSSPVATPQPARPTPLPGHTPAPTAAPQPASGLWKPAPLTTWYEQLQGGVDVSRAYSVFELDGFDTSASTVAALHARGRHVICYIDAGAWESYRSDASQFPASVLGSSAGSGERWLDVRQTSVLDPLMQQRMAMCHSKGFDAVDLDRVDGYANSSGFPLTAQDQLTYNRALAGIAHAAGLSVALHGDVDQAAALVSSFDFSIVEQCFQFSECASTAPFSGAGKAIFEVEYQSMPPCATARQEGMSAAQASTALDGTTWNSC